MGNFWKQGVAAAAIATFGGAAMAGTVTVDGKVNASEYDVFWTIASGNDGGVAGGLLVYASQGANGHLYMGFVLPLNYVDNTYGADDGTPQAAGVEAGSSKGWTDAGKEPHDFKELVGSDRIDGLNFVVNGKTVLGMDVDYVSNLNGGTETKGGTAIWGSGGVTAGEGKVNTGSLLDSGDSMTVKTAMDYNATLTGASNYIYIGATSPSSAQVPGWEYKVMYEFDLFDKSWLNGQSFNFANMTIGGQSFSFNFFGSEGVHASPHMMGTFDDTEVTDGGTPITPVVPLPSSVWMGGLTLAGAIGMLRLRRRKATELS